MIASFLAAWMLLTRVPVPARWSSHEPETIRRSVAWFGLIGIFVGAVGGLPFLLDGLPSHYAVLLSIVLTLLLTGALHEDGFADSCDGIFGGDSPERRLEIMKDSRVGAFGLLGLVMALAFRFFLLEDLSSEGKVTDFLPLVAVLLPVAASLSRTATVVLLFVDGRLASAGEDEPESKVSHFFQVSRPIDVVLTVSISIIGGVLLIGPKVFAACFVVAALIAFVALLFFRHKLKRLNGDALGACVVAVELGVLATALLFTGTAGVPPASSFDTGGTPAVPVALGGYPQS